MKKVLLTIVMCMLLCCALTIFASAASVTDDGTNVTLGNCTITGLDGVTIPSPTRGLVYTLDDETMTATVSGKGSFTGGEGVSLVFPSSVTYNEKTYSLTTINSQLFQGLTYDLYIPDSVITIKGGDRTGTFGNATISKVYIGTGVKEFGRETFSGAKPYTVFVCKAKPEIIGIYAFNGNSAVSGGMTAFELDLSHAVRIEQLAFNSATFLNGQSIEFGDCLEYVGVEAFLSSKATGKITIPENCVLSNRCFNGTSFSRIMINVPKGQTKALPAELVSGASGGLSIVFNGPAIAGGNYVLSMSSMSIYMLTKEDVQAFATSISQYDGKERISNATFYTCEGESYTSTSAGVLSEPKTVEPHCYTDELVHLEANCSNYERDTYICYACGYEKIVSQGTELGNHVFETTTKAPSCQSIGYTEYHCTVCGYEESGAFVDKASHSNTVEKYGAVTGSNLEVSYYCEYCNTLDRTESVSLVNKCYIEGYGLFDATATLDYISVDANGVVTPSSATFERANLYFPSFVKVGDDIVEVKQIKGFNGKSIRAIYVPDTVTRIVGGSGVGCFGNNSALLIVVVGKGVTVVEQEVFSMGGGANLNEFVWKGTITEIHTLAFQNMNASSTSIPYEFKTNLTYVGKQVNLNGNIIREAHIAKGCNLSEKFAFNNANGLVTVYIEGGDTPETALDLGQEFTSNTGTKYYYIKGYVTVSGQAVLAGLNNTRIFMDSVDAIDVFASAIKKNGYASRMDNATFLDCETQKAWLIKSSEDRKEHTAVAFYHGGVFTKTEATCTQMGYDIESCFVCGATITRDETPMLEHDYDGGVITKMPDCKDLGVIVYTCIGCGESDEFAIFRDYTTHEYEHLISYINGFDKNGTERDVCTICDDVQNEEALLPIIVALGYSVKDDRTGIDGGYTIDLALLDKYEAINGKTKIGILIVNAEKSAALGGVLGSNNKLLSEKGVQVELASRLYSSFNLSITGFTTDALRELDLVISAYVIADLDGDGVEEASYIQYTMPDKDNGEAEFGGLTLNTVSIDRACPAPVAPAAYTGKED